MHARSRRTGTSRVLRLAAGLAAGGVVCIIASVLIAYLIADHSSSDSSPSSLTAIGLGGLGVLLILLGGLLLIGGGLERLWRRARPPSGGSPRRS
jgi:multisubunit Na+/H+ antiporter MnhB subunit